MVNRPPIPIPAGPALQLVAPPYGGFDVPRPDAPLGSFVVLDLEGASAVDVLLAPLRDMPWVPLVVVQRQGTRLSPELLRELNDVPGMPAYVLKRPDEGLSLAQLGQDAIRARLPLDVDRAAAWIAARMSRPNLAPSLTVAMSAPERQGWLARLSPAGRWLASRLKALGPLTAGDWRDVYRFAEVISSAGRFTIAEAAEQMGIDVWTMRRRLERLAGITLEQYRSLAGWEWFLEAVVRKARTAQAGKHASEEVNK